MHISFSAFLVIILGLSALTVSADDEPKVDLTIANTVEIAIKNNPLIWATRFDHAASKSEIREIWSAYLPQVSFQNRSSTTESDRFGADLQQAGFAGDTYENKVQLSQLVFDYNVIGNIKQAHLREEAAQWQLKGQEQEIIQLALMAYLDILRAQELLTVQQQRLELTEKQLKTVTDNFEAGYRIKTDVTRSRLEMTSAIQDVRRAENTLARSMVALNLAMGQAVGDRFDIQGEYLVDYFPPDAIEEIQDHKDLYFELIEIQNPTIRIAKLVLNQFEESVRIAKNEALPSVSASGNWGFFDRGQLNMEDEEWSANVMVNIPIFEGGRINAKVDRTQMQYQGEKMRLQNVISNIRSQIETGILTLLEEKQHLELALEALAVAELNYRDHYELYQEGMIPTVDVVEALTNLVESQTDLVFFRYNYLRVVVQLLNAMGSLPREQQVYVNRDWVEQRLLQPWHLNDPRVDLQIKQ